MSQDKEGNQRGSSSYLFNKKNTVSLSRRRNSLQVLRGISYVCHKLNLIRQNPFSPQQLSKDLEVSFTQLFLHRHTSIARYRQTKNKALIAQLKKNNNVPIQSSNFLKSLDLSLSFSSHIHQQNTFLITSKNGPAASARTTGHSLSHLARQSISQSTNIY